MGIQTLLPLIVTICISYAGVDSAVFTVKNNCGNEIWPATLTGQGAPALTGFELAPQASKTLNIPSPWSGRFWARSQCSNSSGKFTCLTGDCNSGQVECRVGGTPPATLAEFTLAGADGKDFFDISLVDGFNLPLSVSPVGSGCQSTACLGDINNGCPDELAVKDPSGMIVGCKSACAALNQPQYCCTGAYGSPATCKPTNYSMIFKSKCPQAYSYAYDDKTSIVTCPTGGNYDITFCP